jgi:class 3 adenylate cyclase/tetratricopeptide (TPR) repeat protein
MSQVIPPGDTGRDAELGRFRSLSVLVCDMVSSTDIRVRLGADGERLLRLLESLTRDAVEAAGGTVIKSLGDGALAVFEAAAEAVAAAIRLQRALDALHRRGEATDLQVRVGVSAGDISVGADDCYGLPVAEAVRLCAEAQAGEILVADVVRALARHGLEVSLTRVGELELRGMGEPVTAWRADWEPQRDGWSAVPLPARLATPTVGRFVGRAATVSTLIDRMKPGPDRTVLVLAGEAGVGKSALAAEVARRMHASYGAVVVHGLCDEELRPPYQPFVQALRHLVRHAPTSALESYVRRHGSDLSVLVPDLVDRLGRVPPARSNAQSADRYLLFRSVCGLLDEVLAETPVVLVLDDLHWADRGTLLLLKHVVTATELPGLAVIGTFRDNELDASNGLQDLLAELHRYEGVERVDLEGLDADDLEELASAVLRLQSTAVSAVARAVAEETDGNPFFAIELLRHLGESGHIDELPSLLDLPPSVREVVRRRVRRLGDDVLRLLSTAAVLGVEFNVDVLADVASVPPDTALDQVESAVHADVLREVPGQSRFRFTHALVQHTLYDDLSQTRRRRLHRAAAEATERAGATTTAAAHWLSAGELADQLRTVAACTAAADEALIARAPDEAMRWYAAALEQLGANNDRPLRCELLLRLGEAQRLAADPAHRVTLRQAAALARELGDAERLARAVLATTRWFSVIVGATDADQVELIEATLALVGDRPSATRARLLATLVAELVYSDRSSERYALADEALSVARTVADAEALFDVLFWRNTAAGGLGGDVRCNDEEVAELAELARELDPLRQAMADLVLVMHSLERGRLADADDATRRATQLAEELRLPLLRWLVTVLRAARATLSGDLDGGEQLCREALELSQATDQPDAATWFGVQLYMVRYEQGRLDELVDMAQAAIGAAPRLYTWHSALAMALTELGRFDEARHLVDELMALDYPNRRHEPHWLVGMATLGSAVAALGDTRDARIVYAALESCAGRFATIMPLSLGSVDRVRGELALALGEWAVAADHFRAAITACDATPAPSFAARSRLGLMTALAALGDGNAAEIATLRAQVRATCDQHDLPRVEALLAAHPAGAGRATTTQVTLPRQQSQPAQT